jgi:hypothetical protein
MCSGRAYVIYIDLLCVSIFFSTRFYMLKGGAFLRATKCFNGSSTEGKALRRDAKSRIAPQLRPGALTERRNDAVKDTR